MYDYHAFGLRLRSAWRIPGLIPEADVPSGSPDTSVWLGPEVPAWAAAALASGERRLLYPTLACRDGGEPQIAVWGLADGAWYELCFSDGTVFVVERDGRRVWGRWPPGQTLEDTATYLLGPVMGLMLRVRGTVVLHGSTVALGGGAVALVGPSGVGKSTTAAAFAQAGERVMGEDLAALRETAGAVLVEPSYPVVRLWPESVISLFGAEEALPRLTPGWEKRYLPLGEAGRYQSEALPLLAVYLLDERLPSEAVRPVVSAETTSAALLTLLGNVYANQFLEHVLRQRTFDLLRRIAETVPVRRVRPPNAVDRVGELCAAIRADVATLAGAGSTLAAG